MSGIPVYTQSPIRTASKPEGITPKMTGSEEPSRTTGPAPNEATTTALPISSYPSAQPGSRPPAPTGISQNYAPLQPTPTTNFQAEGPPAPQPGAFPTPSNKSIIPPPPKIGEKYNPPPGPEASAAPTYLPPQMSMPAPTAAIGSHLPPTSSTTTSTSSYPVSLPSNDYGQGRRSLEHPPGYQQNTNAAEMSADQRRAQESQSNTTNFGVLGSNPSSGGFEEESMWNTAKTWAAQAGGKIQAVEAEVWKKINKQ